MAIRDDRVVDNQRTFRSASDRLQDIVIVEEQRLVPFLCECADPACTGRVHATVAEFGAAHGELGGSFLRPGHSRVAGEKVLSREGRFDVVSPA